MPKSIRKIDFGTKSYMNGIRGGQRDGAGRKQSWKHGETQTIRVPKVLVAQILAIARRLDNGEIIDFETKSKSKRSLKKESDTKSKLSSDFVSDSNAELFPMGAKPLARRLGVSDTAVRKHRDGIDQPGIPEWTRAKDPHGIAWEYREDTKMFHPIDC